MAKIHKVKPLRFRSIWISDVHLGFKGCKADYLLDFLKHTHSEYLYLVGDIVDIWSMKKSVFWPQAHNNVLRKILTKAKKGTKVVYIPGNHDELFRDHVGVHFGSIEIKKEELHISQQGLQFLILHGDEFDSAVKCNKILEIIGNHAYDVILELNRVVNFIRKKFGFPYWSLSTYLKHKVKNAVEYIDRFELAVAHEAHRRKVDGLICGHIHKSNLRDINGIRYCNTGDWVENCTALVEHRNGEMEILHWADEMNKREQNIAAKSIKQVA
ncbi:MAG: UDP-2,3-diacylglucosamine diphosphatase [Gammaproteobacteria bacterium]|jgi:UDP-2,3-diacylglucosamine pyrophosphatase LpxH